MLDIVGQCTPPPPTKAGGQGKAAALSAGCGAADAYAIRTNCCALISLLASAVLVTGVTATTGDTETAIDTASPDLETGAALAEECVDKSGGGGGTAPNSSSDHVGGDGGGGGDGGWDTFVPMSAKPNPDVVCLVRKKGWAARQQQQQSLVQPKAVAIANDSTRSRVPMTYGRGKKKHRRARRKSPGATISDDANFRGSPVHPGRSAVSKTGLAMSPGQTSKGLVQARTVCAIPPSTSAGRTDNNDRRAGGNDRSSGDNTRDGNPSRGGMQHDNIASDARQPYPHHHQPMSDCLASPPRLSRIKGGGIPALLPISPGWPASSARHPEVAPLGLSSPGISNQTRPAKVVIAAADGRSQKLCCCLVCGRAEIFRGLFCSRLIDTAVFVKRSVVCAGPHFRAARWGGMTCGSEIQASSWLSKIVVEASL